VKNGKYVLLPITDQTRGHGTHSWPAIWGNYLEELLKRSALEKCGRAALQGLARDRLLAMAWH